MAQFIERPVTVKAAGNMEKTIEEFVGRVASGTDAVSVARMKSPAGWTEPGQTPEFAEYTVVLMGTVRIETRKGSYDVCEGQATCVESGEWVRYGTPLPGGAEYFSICLPAFSPEIVHRNESENKES